MILASIAYVLVAALTAGLFWRQFEREGTMAMAPLQERSFAVYAGIIWPISVPTWFLTRGGRR